MATCLLIASYNSEQDDFGRQTNPITEAVNVNTTAAHTAQCLHICFTSIGIERQWSISDVKYLPLNEKLLGDNLFGVVFNNSEPKSQQ